MWRWQRGQIANTAVAAGSAAGSTEPVRCDDGELGGTGQGTMKEDWSVVNRVTHARGLKCRRRGSLPSGGFGVRFTGTSVREAKPKEWSQGKEMPFASQLYQCAPQTVLRKQQKDKSKCCERLYQWREG